MVISHQHKFIYVRIPKTASSSLVYSWKSICGGKKQKTMGKKVPGGKHAYAIDIKRKLVPTEWKKYYKASFVRNPWCRIISMYVFYVYVQGIYREYKDNFDGFIEVLHKDRPGYFRQLNWLTDQKGNLMVDYIGRYEKLYKGYVHICKKIGVKPLMKNKFPHKRATVCATKDTIKKYYSKDSIERVNELCKDDIEFFNYSLSD